MENNLERYKSVIRTQNTAFAAALIILVAVITLSFCEVIKPFDAGEKYSSMYNGFIGGLNSLACRFALRKQLFATLTFSFTSFVLIRSEERRVGKEC